ncbi:MAG TPA: GNAT family N-acetyltransferase [Nitrospira sp.]|nr:GNAT family N-acetyltransferase [Nitrospira sp.]
MNPDLIAIRPATEYDVQAILEFNAALALETEQRRLDLDRLRKGTLALLTQPQHGFYIVAEPSAGAIRTAVGQLMITFEWSDWRNGVFWWMQSVYVKPEWRRRGVYRAMHEHIAARAKKDSQVCGIRLYVEHRNHDAQTVYQRVGLSPSVYTVYEQDFILGPQRPNP